MAASQRLYEALAHTFGLEMWQLDHFKQDGYDWADAARIEIDNVMRAVATDLKVDNPRFDAPRFFSAVEADRRKRHQLAAQRAEEQQ
jgi:hypothetical protein